MGSTADTYCIRWDGFKSNVSSNFQRLREDTEFCDVTLCCNNGSDTLQAHKVILAASSPLFRKILTLQKHQAHPLLYLKGIKFQELEAVLNFMYYGEVNVAEDALDKFLAVAKELAVKGLSSDDPKLCAKKKPVAAKRKTPLKPFVPTMKRKKPDVDNDASKDAAEKSNEKSHEEIKAEIPEASGASQTEPVEGDPVDDRVDASRHDDSDVDYGDFDESLDTVRRSGAKGFTREVKESAEVLQTGKKGFLRLLDLKGYIYQRGDLKKSGKTYWRCEKWRKEMLSCKAKAYTVDNIIVTRSGFHNHAPNKI